MYYNITVEGSRQQHKQRIGLIQQKKDFALLNGQCPKCHGNLVERKGKYGLFWGCSNYPNCRFTYKN